MMDARDGCAVPRGGGEPDVDANQTSPKLAKMMFKR